MLSVCFLYITSLQCFTVKAPAGDKRSGLFCSSVCGDKEKPLDNNRLQAPTKDPEVA